MDAINSNSTFENNFHCYYWNTVETGDINKPAQFCQQEKCKGSAENQTEYTKKNYRGIFLSGRLIRTSNDIIAGNGRLLMCFICKKL